MSASSQPSVDTGAVIVPITDGEPILRNAQREISILLARKQITITHARYSAGQPVAGPHIHRKHTDAFYVLEGELTFHIGREAKTITFAAGGLIAAPPRVAHSFANNSDRPARWLTIHAHDGGFAAFMRGVRDRIKVQWDISAVPADGGQPASAAIVSPNHADERGETERQPCRLRCALPDLRVADWRLRGPQPLGLPLRDRDSQPHDQHSQIDTILILDGTVEASSPARHTPSDPENSSRSPTPRRTRFTNRARTRADPEPSHTQPAQKRRVPGLLLRRVAEVPRILQSSSEATADRGAALHQKRDACSRRFAQAGSALSALEKQK